MTMHKMPDGEWLETRGIKRGDGSYIAFIQYGKTEGANKGSAVIYEGRKKFASRAEALAYAEVCCEGDYNLKCQLEKGRRMVKGLPRYKGVGEF